MVIARSKLTSQGRMSVPAEVRRKLGLVPGSVLEWDEEDGDVVVRRVGRYSSEDINAALFSRAAPEPRTLRELKNTRRRSRARQ
jgi:AbrB family looped-hinge helix DNA binding protein